MSEFSFMAETDLDNIVDVPLLPEGWEGEVRITEATPNGEKYYLRTFLQPIGVENEEYYKIQHLVFFPKPDDDSVKVNNKKKGIVNFLQAFGADQQEAFSNPDSLVGKQANVLLGIEPADGQWPEKNKVNKFL